MSCKTGLNIRADFYTLNSLPELLSSLDKKMIPDLLYVTWSERVFLLFKVTHECPSSEPEFRFKGIKIIIFNFDFPD